MGLPQPALADGMSGLANRIESLSSRSEGVGAGLAMACIIKVRIGGHAGRFLGTIFADLGFIWAPFGRLEHSLGSI